MIHINIVGTGRVGKTFLRLFELLPQHTVTGVGKKEATAQLPHASLFFITVPDDHIADVAKTVCQHHTNTILVHCSGSLPASILNPEKRDDIQVASIHPAISIVDPVKTAANFSGTICSVEGDTPAVETVSALFTKLGAELFAIDPSKKAAYHAANCMAANYLVTLAEASCQQFAEAGLNKETSKKISEQLMQSALDNVKQKEHIADALTGPIARGDSNTIQRHLAAIKPELKDLYCELAEQTAAIARQAPPPV
jgi:predicted short-subunit dehydrogenase-like oxidoreductase (DUF2520 family)